MFFTLLKFLSNRWVVSSRVEATMTSHLGSANGENTCFLTVSYPPLVPRVTRLITRKIPVAKSRTAPKMPLC